MIEITQAETPEQIKEIRRLFREYEARLGIDLCFQDFAREIAELPGKYARPTGRLFLIYLETEAAGCIALRKINAETCEMKRLYVRESFRGRRFGKMLIEKLIEEARRVGYKKMRLDTLPDKMPSAVELYKSYGFYEIPPYYNNPHREALFMELDLEK